MAGPKIIRDHHESARCHRHLSIEQVPPNKPKRLPLRRRASTKPAEFEAAIRASLGLGWATLRELLTGRAFAPPSQSPAWTRQPHRHEPMITQSVPGLLLSHPKGALSRTPKGAERAERAKGGNPLKSDPSSASLHISPAHFASRMQASPLARMASCGGRRPAKARHSRGNGRGSDEGHRAVDRPRARTATSGLGRIAADTAEPWRKNPRGSVPGGASRRSRPIWQAGQSRRGRAAGPRLVSEHLRQLFRRAARGPRPSAAPSTMPFPSLAGLAAALAPLRSMRALGAERLSRIPRSFDASPSPFAPSWAAPPRPIPPAFAAILMSG